MNDLSLMLEAERRGILPPDKQAVLNEARSRGLVEAGGKPESSSDGLERPHDFMGESISGYTLGGAGHIAAAAGSLVRTGKELLTEGTASPARHYGEALDEYQGRQDQYREENPVSSIAANVLGGAAGVTTTPLRALLPLKSGAPLAANVARGAVQGGLIGGVAGGLESRGDTASDIATDAALGLGVGGALGAAAPMIGEGVRRIASSRAGRQAAAKVGASRPAQTILNRAMDADGSFSGRGAANIARAGDDAMLADAGPNTRTLLDTAIQRSGRAGTIAREAIEERATNAGRAMSGSLDDAFGPSTGLRSTERGIRQGTAAARSAAYDLAYSKPIDYASKAGQRLERIVKDRVPMAAIRKANELMRTEGGGDATKHILAHVDDAGNAVFEELPDVRQLDYITRGLREVADRADGAGKLGGQTQLGNAYSRLSGEIRSLTRELVPEYSAALETAARPIEARNALQFGSRLLSQRVTRDEAAEMIGRMSGAEKMNAAQGVRSQIDEALSNVRRAMLDTNMDAREALKVARDLSSRASREKIGLLIGDEPAVKLFEQLDKSTAALDLRSGVAANSRTFARQSMDDIIQEEIDGGIVGSIRDGRPFAGARATFQRMTGRSPEALQAKGDVIREEIARILTERRGPEALKTLEALKGLAQSEDPALAVVVETAIQRLSPSSPAVLNTVSQN